jgi:etoposide-induced 2.4 mRNA
MFVIQALRSIACGFQEALDVRRTYRAIADSTTIRTCVIRCTLLNGVLLMGSVVLFEYVIRPLVAAARLSPDDMAADWRRDALTAVFSLLYYVLWIFPWYVLSYIFNAGWYSKIAKRYFELRQPKRAPPDAMSSSGSAAASASLAQSSGPESAGSAWESVLASLLELQRNAAEAVYTIFLFLGMGIQCSLVGYLPLLGAPLQIAMFAWLSAFYCFDYRWRFGGFNIEQRKQAFASDWAFFLGFGLPITLASHFLPFFISYGIYAVVFPPMIITCIAAQRREPDNGRLGTPPLFVAPSLIAAACVWVLMRGRTVPPGAKTK